MTAKELDTMVKAMRTRYNKVDTRMDVQNTLYYLYKGLSSIGRNDIAKQLIRLYEEVDEISTASIMEMGTFNK